MQETPVTTPVTTPTRDTMPTPPPSPTPTMNAAEKEKRGCLLAQIEETESIIQDLTRGKSLEEIAKDRGIPSWKLGLRIAHYGLDCMAVAVECLLPRSRTTTTTTTTQHSQQYMSSSSSSQGGPERYIVQEALVVVMYGKSPRGALKMVYDELEESGIVFD